MTENREPSRRVTLEQAKSILDFMGQHVEFACGNLRSLEARHTSKKLWADLTIILNSCRGTKKTSDGWSKYWSDYKNKLKRRVWLLKKNKLNRSLTKLEKRAMVILGWRLDFEKRKSRESYSNTIEDPLPPEVKLESFQEIISNNIHKAHSDSNDKTSDVDDNNSCGVSSDDECADDNDNNDLALHNLYPKWLIEVEKKRAQAELIRAKAEEERVVVASKNAEAVLLQADALKRLADAAAVQAEAIMRIAAVLESRGQTDMLVI